MNKQQIKVFEELLRDPNFKGKKTLENLLWLNTSKPKFKTGQLVTGKYTDVSLKVVKVEALKTANEWFYTLKDVEDNDTVFAFESEIKSKEC